jgi:hypothetical protein
MRRNRAKIDHPETASALNLRSHSIDKLNHYDRRIHVSEGFDRSPAKASLCLQEFSCCGF